MIPIRSILTSSVGQKYAMAVSGIALVLFILTHLAANTLLYFPTMNFFNAYVKGLHAWGPVLTVAELGLAFLFLFHIVLALFLAAKNKGARGVGYLQKRSKSGVAQNNIASRNMKVTGIVLLGFLVLHIWQFRFGPNVAEGYVTILDGVETRDLFRLVFETFQDIRWVVVYMVSMLVFGFHLRHGVWSAFQSLGLMNSRTKNGLYLFALVFAIVIAAAFFFMPIWLYLDPFGLGGSL